MKKDTLRNCYINIDNQDAQQVLDVLKSDSISGKSDVVAQYEGELADFFQTKYAITCTNGTSAIQIKAVMRIVRWSGNLSV